MAVLREDRQTLAGLHVVASNRLIGKSQDSIRGRSFRSTGPAIRLPPSAGKGVGLDKADDYEVPDEHCGDGTSLLIEKEADHDYRTVGTHHSPRRVIVKGIQPNVGPWSWRTKVPRWKEIVVTRRHRV